LNNYQQRRPGTTANNRTQTGRAPNRPQMQKSYRGQGTIGQTRGPNAFSQPKAKKKVKKLTKEQIKQIREQKAYLRSKQIKKVLQKITVKAILSAKVILSSLALTLIFLLLYVLIMALMIFSGTKKKYDCTYTIGRYEENIIEHTYDEEYVIPNDVPYVNVDDLIDYCGFSVSGDASQIKIIITGKDSSYVSFTKGDSNIYINGTRYRMNEPVIKRGDSMWIPIEFLNKYVNGVTATYDYEEHSLLVCKDYTDECAELVDKYEKSREDDDTTNNIPYSTLKFEYKEMSFSAVPHNATSVIREDSLSSTILYLTDPVRLAEEAEQKRLAEEAALLAEQQALLQQNQ